MSSETESTILDRSRLDFKEIVKSADLLGAEVSVLAKLLTPEEAIGSPGRRDFPIIIGKERMLESCVLGSRGHAFTDSRREFQGTIAEVLNLDLTTNQNRAIYVATLNAVMGHLGMVKATVHCKDEDPEKCALEIAANLLSKFGKVEVGLIGLNPAIGERLSETFGKDHLRITDLNADNIGKHRFGVVIWDGNAQTEELIKASDLVVFTGTTLTNNSFDQIWDLIRKHGKDYVVYGVTAAGVCNLLDIDRICPCGLA